ncbi:MAG: type II secretion system protein, partial [Burkholderiales bacterium]
MIARRYRRAHAQHHRCCGFTLAEAIIVIAISGIVAAAVAVFIRGPIQGYFDTAARAELTDIADTALRRIGREVRAALPNSIRVLGTCDGASACYLEFIPTVDGGRYRADVKADGTGDPLLFNTNDATFDVLGPPLTIPAGSWVVVYNLGVAGSDAYQGGVNPSLITQNRRSANAAVGTSNVSLATTTRFPYESPAKRFHVVQQ